MFEQVSQLFYLGWVLFTKKNRFSLRKSGFLLAQVYIFNGSSNQ